MRRRRRRQCQMQTKPSAGLWPTDEKDVCRLQGGPLDGESGRNNFYCVADVVAVCVFDNYRTSTSHFLRVHKDTHNVVAGFFAISSSRQALVVETRATISSSAMSASLSFDSASVAALAAAEASFFSLFAPLMSVAPSLTCQLKDLRLPRRPCAGG